MRIPLCRDSLDAEVFSFRLDYTNKAVNSARSARKKRWICFFIIVIVLIIVAIVLAVVITNNIKNTGNALGNRN